MLVYPEMIGLQVPMNKPALVQVLEPSQQIRQHRRSACRRRERGPADQLQGDRRRLSKSAGHVEQARKGGVSLLE